jgi:N utilization substance protein B
MATRTEQRRAAIWALYQSDLLDRPLEEVFPRYMHAFSRALAIEVQTNQSQLDELISRHASGWSLGRIAPVERSILRVALLEMTHPELVPGERPIPPEAAIDEAIETAKEFCGADAPGFVNGILAAALRDLHAARS